MKNVKIEPGCISCHSCEFIAPEVFEVTDVSRVKDGVDLEKYKEKIKLAAEKCPMQVIKIKD